MVTATAIVGRSKVDLEQMVGVENADILRKENKYDFFTFFEEIDGRRITKYTYPEIINTSEWSEQRGHKYGKHPDIGIYRRVELTPGRHTYGWDYAPKNRSQIEYEALLNYRDIVGKGEIEVVPHGVYVLNVTLELIYGVKLGKGPWHYSYRYIKHNVIKTEMRYDQPTRTVIHPTDSKLFFKVDE